MRCDTAVLMCTESLVKAVNGSGLSEFGLSKARRRSDCGRWGVARNRIPSLCTLAL